MKQIAIIGAGLSGLFIAHSMNSVARLTIFEKSYRVGGRASSRIVSKIGFDHGAQFFSAKNHQFEELLSKMLLEGVVSVWHGKLVSVDSATLRFSNLKHKKRYVGTPRMQSICEFLAKGVDLKLNSRVNSIERKNGKWLLRTGCDTNQLEFDWVIFTIPPAQVTDLLPLNMAWMSKLKTLQMLPCISLMGILKQPHQAPWDGAFIKNSLLGWIGFNNSKLKRPLRLSLVAQTNYDWAFENMNRSDNEIKSQVANEIRRIMLDDQLIFDQFELKRWANAVISQPLGEDFLIDKEQSIAIAGDWCVGSKIESSFKSAMNLTRKLLNEVV